MQKRIISFLLLSLVFIIALFPVAINADNSTKQKIENIIDGKQDYLVLVNIIEKGTSDYEVQVFEEIGSKDDEENKLPSIKDERIYVSGFSGYMYYDNTDYRPQKGDNVLLSLDYRSGRYSVKNGAYLVDSTSYEQLKFKMPDVFNGTQEALEINALYIFVNSNGAINSLTIKNDGIYGKDANGEAKKVEAVNGIVYIDEYGDHTENPTAPVERYNENSLGVKSKWKLVFFIIILGAVSGLGVVKLVRKLEKRYEQ